MAARQQFVVEHAEGKQVAQRIGGGGSRKLLRRRVIVAVVPVRTDDAEILERHAAVTGQDDSRGTNAEMRDAAAVRGLHTLRHLPHDQHLFEQRKRPLRLDDPPQILAFEMLHGRERQADMLSQFVYRDEGGMAEPGGRGHFAAKAVLQFLIGDVREDRQRDGPAGIPVEPPEHLHPGAFFDLRLDLVFSNSSSERPLQPVNSG